MKTNDLEETTIGVTSFKAKCLAMIDDIAKGRTSRVLLVKHNRPVAALVPIADQFPDPWGALIGTVIVESGVDLTEPTGEIWKADL